MSTDTFLLILFTNLFTLALSTMFYASRIYEIRVEHVEQIQQINAETMMQREVYGQVSMEQLIGRESFDETL